LLTAFGSPIPQPTERAKYWEIIADNLSKAGWSWGCVSAFDSEGRTIWIADAHRSEAKALLKKRAGAKKDGRSRSVL
jgi:hypothetical protein